MLCYFLSSEIGDHVVSDLTLICQHELKVTEEPSRKRQSWDQLTKLTCLNYNPPSHGSGILGSS